MLKKENDRLGVEIVSLKNETREAEARQRDEVEMLKEENQRLSRKIASLEDEMRKGEVRGREEVEMSKEESVRLRMNEELLHKIKRVLELDKAAGVLRNEEQMKNEEREKGVPGEVNGFDIKS